MKAAKSSCRGIAFEFPDDKEQEIRGYLIKREGRGFELRKLAICLEDGTSANAVVAVYEGENILETHDLRALGRQIHAARGKDGTCVAYIQGIARKLEQAGIADPVVTDLARVVAESTQRIGSSVRKGQRQEPLERHGK